MSTFNGYMRAFPNLTVDFFRGVSGRPAPLAGLLSHVHSDHLAGLETHRGYFVYCSAATRALVLRLERRAGRDAYASGTAEARPRPTYAHLRGLLKALPLDTPTRVEVGREVIQVTLLDANHCVGAVMFLIEGGGKAVLYTGDIRAEPWWVNSLVRHPAVVEYASARLWPLDCVYLDTSNVSDTALQTKAEGLSHLLRRAVEYPPDTVFYMHAWTYGYEEVWMALAKALRTRIHVDDYKLGLYSSLTDTSTSREVIHCKEGPGLVGFTRGNQQQEGILTASTKNARIHSCDLKNAPCKALELAINAGKVVWLRPIVGWQNPNRLRRDPDEVIPEAGLVAVLGEGGGRPEDQYGPYEPYLDQTSLEPMSDHITFAYARHSSLPELRHLIGALGPQTVWPCTADMALWTQQGLSIRGLFGDYCHSELEQVDHEFDLTLRAWQEEHAAETEGSQDNSQTTAAGSLQFREEVDEEEASDPGVAGDVNKEDEQEQEADKEAEDRNAASTDRAPKRGYGEYRHSNDQDDDDGETGGGSQASALSARAWETRTRAFRAMDNNSRGVAGWASIELISTTAHHSSPEPDLGTLGTDSN